MTFRVDIDSREMTSFIRRFTAPEVDKMLRKGATAAGKVMKLIVRPAIPVGSTGNLRGALKAKAIRRRYGIGVVVGPMGKKASHRHLVIGGTKPRFTKSGAYRGVMPPNPWLDRVDGPAYAAGESAFQAEIDKTLRKP